MVWPCKLKLCTSVRIPRGIPKQTFDFNYKNIAVKSYQNKAKNYISEGEKLFLETHMVAFLSYFAVSYHRILKSKKTPCINCSQRPSSHYLPVSSIWIENDKANFNNNSEDYR